MIPVLIAPVVGHVEKLEATLASVDEPVGRTVIVDMTPDGLKLDGALHIRPLISLGLAGALNAAISQTPDAPWWLFVTDIVFGPGDLAEIAYLVEQDAGPVFVTGDRKDERMLRNAYGALNVACVERVGLFDEWAFYPLYYDDDDWERRCALGGVEWVEYNGQIRHERSLTIRGDRDAYQGNVRTFPQNLRRYVEKWGGPPGSERFETPYDSGAPLSFVRPDPAGRAARRW